MLLVHSGSQAEKPIRGDDGSRDIGLRDIHRAVTCIVVGRRPNPTDPVAFPRSARPLTLVLSLRRDVGAVGPDDRASPAGYAR
jgi:hypothetical protein